MGPRDPGARIQGDRGLPGLWFAAYIGVDHLPVPYSGLFTPFVALLDVALVLIIFKGDIRIG